MNYKEIRSKSAFPREKRVENQTNIITSSRNSKYNITIEPGKDSVSSQKTPTQGLTKNYGEKTYSEMLREKEVQHSGNSFKKSYPIKISKSPLRVSNTPINNNNDAIKTKIKKVFEYYCQFGERMNISSLKTHKFQKFALDAEIIDEKLSKTRLELIFSSENKNKSKSQMDFPTFLNTLIKIAEYKYIINSTTSKYSNTSNTALQTLLKNHVFPLYDKLFEVQGVDQSLISDFAQNDINLNKMDSTSSPIKGRDTSDLQENSYTPTQSNYGNSHTRMSVINNINVDELMMNSQLEDILKSVAPIMFDVYKVYFPWEISLSENESFFKDNSLKAYFVFLKDYELCPNLISKSSAFQIFQTETNSNDDGNNLINEIYSNVIKNIEINPLGRSNNRYVIGKYFNFIKFLKSICKIGDHGFDKIETGRKLNTIEKICLTFERMELSDGFLNLEQKTSKTHSRKSSYIIPKETLEKIKANILNKTIDNELVTDEKEAELNHRQTKLRKSILGNFRDLFEHASYILEKYGNQLNTIFKFYCSFGDPMNTQAMKSNKFSKFLKEANLLKMQGSTNYGIKMNDIDVIFFKLAANTGNQGSFMNPSFNQSQMTVNNSTIMSTSSPVKRGSIVNSNAKIDFNGFINGIEVISMTIFPDKNNLEAIDFIIQNNVLPLLDKFVYKNNEMYNAVLKEKNQNKEFMDLINIMSRALTPIYKFYMNKNSLMNFDTFLKFTSDFSIFPDLISKSKLNHYFKTTMSHDYLFNETGENEFIDQTTFVDILAQCAFEVPYRAPEPSYIEKIILFVEKISQSDGPNKILRELGHTRLPNGETLDLLSIFRSNYPEHFTIQSTKKADFFDILNDNENNNI